MAWDVGIRAPGDWLTKHKHAERGKLIEGDVENRTSPPPPVKARRRRPAPRRDAVRTLLALQAEYQEWLDNLPDNLQESAVAEKLQAIVEHDFGDLEALEPPRGSGRDRGGSRPENRTRIAHNAFLVQGSRWGRLAHRRPGEETT